MFAYLLILVIIGFVVLNLLAYSQARAMTHFTASGERTKSSEDLSLLQKAYVLLAGPNIPRPENSKTPADFGLPYTTCKFTSGTDVRIEAWFIAHPQPKGAVLVCPGYAAEKAFVMPEVKAFHELGYSVLPIDFRGAGGSSLDYTTIGYNEADDVAAAFKYIQTLAGKDKPVILYGVSMGGAAILRAIAKEKIQPTAIIIEGMFDRLLSAVRNRFRLMGVPSFPSAELMVFWGSRQIDLDGFNHNPADYAKSVTCPALVLHGTEDPRATLPQARKIYGNLAGRKVFEEFPSVKHESCVVADPERWKKAVGKFLEEVADR